MSTRADIPATLHDPDPRSTRSARTVSIAIIGPHTGRRGVVAKAVSTSDDRIVREFAVYPDKNTDLPRLLDQNFNVVMIDLDSDQNLALQLVQEIASSGKADVIVYSSRNDPTLGMISMHAGAIDFLPIPADASEAAEPSPQPIPERPAQARPVEVRPFERQDSPDARPAARIPDSARYTGDSNGQAHQRPAETPRSFAPPPSTTPQNIAPVRPAQPPIVRTPEPAPRMAVAPEAAARTVPEPRPIPSPAPSSVPSPVPTQRPAQNPVQSAIPRSAPIEPQTAAASQAPSEIQSPPQRPAPTPAQRPTASAAPMPAPNPVDSPAPSANAAEPRTSGGIQTDADVLELFRYGKGEAKVIKDPDALPISKSQKWIFVSLGAVVVAVLVVLVVLRITQSKSPVAQHAPEVATEPPSPASPTPAATGAASPSGVQPTVKPSPAGQAGAGSTGEDVYVPKPAKQVSSDMMDAQLAAKARISKDIKKGNLSDEAPPPGLTTSSMDSAGMQGASLGAFEKTKVLPTVSAISAGVADGMVIRRTPPVYPKIAKESHVSGTVVLGATINRSGTLENVHVISGNQMLRTAAVDALQTWRYRPYLLNNQPVAVQTTINVVFSLGKD